MYISKLAGETKATNLQSRRLRFDVEKMGEKIFQRRSDVALLHLKYLRYGNVSISNKFVSGLPKPHANNSWIRNDSAAIWNCF